MRKQHKDLLASTGKRNLSIGQSIYQQIKEIHTLLQDQSWFSEVTDAEEGESVHRYLERTRLGSLPGRNKLALLTRLIEAYPKEATWAEYEYNPSHLDAKYQEEFGQKPATRESHSWKERALRAEARCEELEAETASLRSELEKAQQDLQQLQKELREVREDKVRLEGRIEGMTSTI